MSAIAKDYRAALGREVRRRRLLLGLTLVKFAARSGLSPNFICTVENGRRDPSLSTVIRLAIGLKLKSVGDLFESERVSAAAIEVGRDFDRVTPELQRAVIDVLRANRKR